MGYSPYASRPFIPLSRAVVALFIAPFFPSLIFTVMNGGGANFQNLFILTLLVGELCALVIGLPAVLVLRNKMKSKLIWAIIFGGVAAVLPWFVLGIFPSADQASLGGQATVVDGQYTSYGFMQFMWLLGVLFGFGAIGGVVFWVIAVWPFGRRAKEIDETSVD